VALSPAALAPHLEFGSPAWTLLDVFDFFSLANLFLLATGARHVLPASTGAAWGIAGAFWTLASAVRVTFLLMMSWFSGTL
jgi:hypothetical protein